MSERAAPNDDRESTLALLAKLRLETEAEEEPADEPAAPPSWPGHPARSTNASPEAAPAKAGGTGQRP